MVKKLLIIVNQKSEKSEFTIEISKFENISSNNLVITIYPKCKKLVNVTGIKNYDETNVRNWTSRRVHGLKTFE